MKFSIKKVTGLVAALVLVNLFVACSCILESISVTTNDLAANQVGFSVRLPGEKANRAVFSSKDIAKYELTVCMEDDIVEERIAYPGEYVQFIFESEGEYNIRVRAFANNEVIAAKSEKTYFTLSYGQGIVPVSIKLLYNIKPVFGIEIEFEDEGTADVKDYDLLNLGDIILIDGTICSPEDYSPNGTPAAAVIVREKSDDLPALGLGIKQGKNLPWCTRDAKAYTQVIKSLLSFYDNSYAYSDGAEGLENLKAVCSDAQNNLKKYPAWDYAINYGRKNSLYYLDNTDWYLPSIKELYTINENKETINKSLKLVGGDLFDKNYWSSCQSNYWYSNAMYFNGTNNDSYGEKDSTNFSVCAVKVFKM